MHVIFIDDIETRERFLPFSDTRPVSDIRLGILTLAEKWAVLFQSSFSFCADSHLRSAYGGVYKYLDSPRETFRPESSIELMQQLNEVEGCILVSGAIIPSAHSLENIRNAEFNTCFYIDSSNWVLKIKSEEYLNFLDSKQEDVLEFFNPNLKNQVIFPFTVIHWPEEMLALIGTEIRADLNILKKIKEFSPASTLSSTNSILGEEIYLEKGVKAEFAIFNASEGPIYIGKNAVILEGAILKGPISIGQNSLIKMGAQIYPNVSIGPFCKIGGEINTSQIWGYTNKGHQGYLGSSLIGAGCNWGAGTSNSNMKNNFSNIKIQSSGNQSKRDSSLKYFGVLMGDYVRTAINSSLNSGSYIGTGSNILYTGLTPSFIPNYSWVDTNGNVEAYLSDKYLETLKHYFSTYGLNWDFTLENNIIVTYKSKYS